MPLLEFSGIAIRSKLDTGIGPSDTTIVLSDGTGWPDGTIGPFIVTLGDKEAGDSIEKVLVTARTGVTPATLSGVTRGYEGVAQSWGPNTPARHTISGDFCADVSGHVYNTGRDDHTQYHTPARHAAVAHTAAMLAADSVGTSELQDDAVGTAEIQDNAVTTPKIPNNGITTPKVPDLAITTPKLNDLAVTAAKIADLAVATGKLDDLAVTVAKIGIGAPTAYSPTFGGFVTPVSPYGFYYQLGRLVVGWAGVLTGSGGVTSSITVSVPVPNGGGFEGLLGARARQPGGAAGGSGLGVIADGTSVGVNITTIGAAEWGNNVPMGWTLNSSLRAVFLYVSA